MLLVRQDGKQNFSNISQYQNTVELRYVISLHLVQLYG